MTSMTQPSVGRFRGVLRRLRWWRSEGQGDDADLSVLRRRLESLQMQLRAAADPEYAARKLGELDSVRAERDAAFEELARYRAVSSAVTRVASPRGSSEARGDRDPDAGAPDEESVVYERPPIHDLRPAASRYGDRGVDPVLRAAEEAAGQRRATELQRWNEERDAECARQQARSPEAREAAAREAHARELAAVCAQGSDPAFIEAVAAAGDADPGLFRDRDRLAAAVQRWRVLYERRRPGAILDSARVLLRRGKCVGVEVATFVNGQPRTTRLDAELVSRRAFWEVEWGAQRDDLG